MSIFRRLRGIVFAEIGSRLNPTEKSSSSSCSNTADSFSEEERLNSKFPHYTNQEEQYYANLEIAPGANFEEIKNSYKRLLKRYHPDKYNNDVRSEHAEQITKKLNEAYNYFKKKLRSKS